MFPLSNWTELDVWHYIDAEQIPVVPLYFAQEREVIVRGESLIVPEQPFVPLLPGERAAARDVPDALARLLAVHRRRALDADTVPQDHRGARRRPAVRAAAARHRPRPGRLDGDEEARGLLLMSGLLRICTAGSVDDGKSTLIGRLLYDSRGVYEDQVRSVEKASKNRTAGPIDFSLFTDGLKAEREQGITIDVAYRYFATARRKFILADTPGHEQYTRNMATGASTADVADPAGRRPPRRPRPDAAPRAIARLLGISHFVLAVNKMDLVDFDRAGVRRHLRRFRGAARAAPRSTRFRSARCTATTSSRPASGRRGSRAGALLDTSRPSKSSAVGRQAVPVAGAARGPARRTTFAATPGRSPRARSAPAIRSRSGRRARRRRVKRIVDLGRRSRMSRSRRCR